MVRLTVRAHPRASQERVALQADGTLEVWVRAPAVEGRANAALLTVLAGALGLRPREVTLVHGARGRQKVVELPLTVDAVRQRLAARSPTARPPDR